MKKTQIATAVAAITRAVEQLECAAAGSPTWEERYYQESADHNTNVNALDAALAARDEALKGWQQVATENEAARASWKQRHDVAAEALSKTNATLDAMCVENDRLNAVLAAIQTACKG